MTQVQSLAPEVREDKYPLLGIIVVLVLNFLSPFVSNLLPYLAMVLCIIRVVRYDEKVFATDYSLMISVVMLFQTPGKMSLMIYLCLFADVWYFLRRGVKAEAAVVLMFVLLNYLLLRVQMSFDRFALCFGQLFLLRILLPAQDYKSARRAAKAFCIGLLVASVYALVLRNTWQYAAVRGPEDAVFFGSSIIRFYGPFQDPNYYSLVLITAMALLAKLKDSRCIGWGAFLAGILLFTFFGVLTYSKSFFLVFVLLVAVYLVWQFWNKKVFRGIFLTLAIIIAGAILLLSEGSPFAVVISRFTSANSVSEITTGRSDVFLRYYRAITEDLGSIFFGKGLAEKNLGLDPHNLFLEITYYLGLVGLVLVGVYYASLIRAINVNLKKQNLIARYVVLLVVLMFHMTVQGMVSFHSYVSFFMAAVSMMILPEEAKETEETPHE